MRIGIDAHRLSKPQINTSGGTYISQLIEHLDGLAAGDEIFLYVKKADRKHVWPKGLKRCVPRMIPGGNVVWRQLVLPWAALMDRVDVLFVPFHSVPILWPGKLVVTIHDLAFVKAPHYFDHRARVYLQGVTAFAIRRATHIITVSYSTRDDIVEEYRISERRITVIYLAARPVFQPHRSEADETVKQRFAISEPYFLFVGGAEGRKNLQNVLCAMNTIAETDGTRCQLVVTGSGVASFLTKGGLLEEKVQGRIRPLGRVSTDELAALYRNAVALVYPSYYEGFGLPIVEAASCGCPAIVSNVSSMPELVGDAGFLVDPSDPGSIARAMTLCLDEAMRLYLRERALVRSRLFSWRKAAAELYQVLRTV